MVHHEWGQGVIVVDWHALAWEHFLKLRRNSLVGAAQNSLTIKRFELDDSHRQSVRKRHLVAINQIVADSANRGMIFLCDGHDKISTELSDGVIALTMEAQDVTRLHAWFDFNLLLHALSLGGSSICAKDCLRERDRLCAAIEEL